MPIIHQVVPIDDRRGYVDKVRSLILPNYLIDPDRAKLLGFVVVPVEDMTIDISGEPFAAFDECLLGRGTSRIVSIFPHDIKRWRPELEEVNATMQIATLYAGGLFLGENSLSEAFVSTLQILYPADGSFLVVNFWNKSHIVAAPEELIVCHFAKDVSELKLEFRSYVESAGPVIRRFEDVEMIFNAPADLYCSEGA